MRLSLLPAALLAAPLVAQGTNLQEFGLHPGFTAYATRASLPSSSAGAVVQIFEGARFHGTAQLATPGGVVGRLHGFRAVVQDQDGSTPQAIGFSLIADDPSNPGRPDPSNAGTLASLPNLGLPTGTGGPSAWLVTATLATPADVVPQAATFHVAVDLPAAPATWPNDGLTVHAYDYGFFAGPRPGAPNLTGALDRTNGNAWTQPTALATLRVALLLDPPVLEMGVDLGTIGGSLPNPAFGIVGIYPNRARGDGLAWRVVDVDRPATRLWLLASFGGFGTGVTQWPLSETVWLDLNALIPFALDQGTLNASGEWFTIVPWARFPAALPQIPITYQVVALPPSGLPVLTNAVSTD